MKIILLVLLVVGRSVAVKLDPVAMTKDRIMDKG